MATTATTTNEKNRKTQSVSQTIDQVMTIKTHTNRQNRSYPRGVNVRSKFICECLFTDVGRVNIRQIGQHPA